MFDLGAAAAGCGEGQFVVLAATECQINARVLGSGRAAGLTPHTRMQRHRAWIQTPRDQNGIQGLRYPLAADFNKTMARDYEVLDENLGVALRGLFIIDPNGTLQYKVVHSLNIGRSVDETLRVLQALQTGGLCPAEWKPGQKTLVV